MSWSTSELRVRLAPLNRFKPSSKIFYWPFQGGTSFVDLSCLCSVLCLLCLCARLFIWALWSPAGKGLTSWLSFVVSAVSLSLSNWYPGSGVVLDCIDSWSLHPYLLHTWSRLWPALYRGQSVPLHGGHNNWPKKDIVLIPDICTLTYFAKLLDELIIHKASDLDGLNARVLKECSNETFPKIVSEYDQEIPQSQTADKPMAPQGRATQPSRDTRKTN